MLDHQIALAVERARFACSEGGANGFQRRVRTLALSNSGPHTGARISRDTVGSQTIPTLDWLPNGIKVTPTHLTLQLACIVEPCNSRYTCLFRTPKLFPPPITVELFPWLRTGNPTLQRCRHFRDNTNETQPTFLYTREKLTTRTPSVQCRCRPPPWQQARN